MGKGHVNASCELQSTLHRRDYVASTLGSIMGVSKGDTGSLDYSSCASNLRETKLAA